MGAPVTTARDHYVYVCVDADAEPVYVGCTARPEKRLAEHAGHAPWWLAVTDSARMGPFTRSQARSIEAELIMCLRPRANTHQSGIRRSRPILQNPAALRRARIAAGFRQNEAAKPAGVSAPYLSRLERGHYSASPATVIRLANLYGVDPATLRNEAVA